MKPTIDEINIKWIPDECADSSYLDQEGFEDRLAAFNNDDFGFAGCTAVATVSYPISEKGDRRLEELASGGLWGIETDSDREYKASVEKEELSDLKAHLETFGVDTSDFWQKAGVTP